MSTSQSEEDASADPRIAAQASENAPIARLALRVAAGLSLLALVVWYADPGALWVELRRADPWLFASAVLVAIAANLLSAARWAIIARGLGLYAPYRRLVLMYARGITTNIVLPGATLSGDLLRSVQLSKIGNSFAASALSVFLDRFSGLWMLCGLSLVAALVCIVWSLGFDGASAVPLDKLVLYSIVLASVVALPLIPFSFARMKNSRHVLLAKFSSSWARLERTILQARPALLASVWRAFGVQFLSTCTFWISGLAVGVPLPFPAMLAAAAPIFVMAALPLGVSGFGAREFAAVIVLGAAGVPSEQAVATSLLYGLASVVQGILAAPLFFTKP
ncbi:MAG: lysylphosphatidylglycerol synthase transmembrane domain-containing protein [Betaproteobacteria bacterium]